MSCFSNDMPAPVNYGQQTRDTLQAQVDLAPQLFASEQKYQPGYADLAASSLGKLYGGVMNTYTGSLPGLTAASSNANTMLRSRDIGDVNALAPAGRQALRTANPDTAALLDKLNAQANQGLEAGSQLTADQQRTVDNSVNSAQGARGVAYGPASAYSNVMATGQYGDNLLASRTATANNVIGQNQNFYGDPYQQILGRTSGAGGASAGLMNVANSTKAGPSLFNPDDPLSGSITAGNKQMEEYHQTTRVAGSGAGQALSSY